MTSYHPLDRSLEWRNAHWAVYDSNTRLGMLMELKKDHKHIYEVT